jgi:prolipoprotein diacylglyceryltransferase
MAIAYAFGEGIGRLACLSFGCCYGKPLSSLPPWLSGLLFRKRMMFTFSGKTKKIAYADGLDRHPILPVQGITAVLYCATGLAATFLFLDDRQATAFAMTIVVTQLWRFGSEFLRADYRGDNRISAYQIMALMGGVYALPVAFVFAWLHPATATRPDILMGLHYLWNPLVMLALQGLGAAIFLFTGRSQVTGAVISFHVRDDRI